MRKMHKCENIVLDKALHLFKGHIIRQYRNNFLDKSTYPFSIILFPFIKIAYPFLPRMSSKTIDNRINVSSI